MRLSVIVPALDEADAIERTLTDLAVLRIRGDEIIVVDGGSTDATIARALPYADHVIDAPRGRARQMNAGADAAAGAVLWFVHADTRIPAHACESVLAALDSGSEWGRFDVRLSGPGLSLRVVERMMNLRSCVTGIATGDQGIFVTRRAFDAVGGYPDIPLMEDIALSKALRQRSRPACIRTPLVTSSRRWERNGVWPTVLFMWRLRLAYALGADPADLAKRYYP